MTLRTRRGIFYLFAFLFVVVGAYLVLLTQGMTIDWTRLKLVRTGAIYLRTTPPNAAILLDKTPYRSEDSILSRGTLVKNLLPRTYHAEVYEDGYYPWEKDLAVEEGLVASASNVVLWPKEMPEQTIASSSVEDFWATGSGLVTEDENGTISFGASALKGTQVVDAGPDENEVVTKDAKGIYLLTDLSNPESPANVSALFSSLYPRAASTTKVAAIASVTLHPFSPGKLFVATSRTLWLLDTRKDTLQRMIAFPSLTDVTVTDDEVFASDGAGNFSGVNLLLGSAVSFSIPTTTIAAVSADPSGTKLFIRDTKGDLFEYDRGTSTSSQLAEGVAGASLSPDEKRIALIGRDGAVKALYLENSVGDVRVPAGSLVPIPVPHALPSSQIEVIWMPDTPNYVLLKNDGDVSAAEIDTRPPANVYPLFSHVKKAVLDGSTLYLLKDDGALASVTLPQ